MNTKYCYWVSNWVDVGSFKNQSDSLMQVEDLQK